MRPCLAVLALSACGRLGFGAGESDPSDGPAADAPDATGTALLGGMTTCQVSPTMLTLDRDADAGTTLVVAFFMREPASSTNPTITGGAASWIADVQFQSVLAQNRRHLSLFRAVLTSKITAGTQLAIEHPEVESSGAAVFVVPGVVDHPASEVPATTEGTGPFLASHTTTAQGALCAVVHHNGGSATFDAPWTPLFDLISDCTGAARQTAGLHLASGPTGAVDCTGALNNDTFAWITVVLGYDELP